MSYAEIIEATERFSQQTPDRQPIANDNVSTMVDNHDNFIDKPIPSESSLERVRKIAASMYDELVITGYEREAFFLFDLCVNMVESGASDAEMSHTAFEFIKLFPEVEASIVEKVHENSASIRRVGNQAIGRQ